jgi:hypothetical protein
VDKFPREKLANESGIHPLSWLSPSASSSRLQKEETQEMKLHMICKSDCMRSLFDPETKTMFALLAFPMMTLEGRFEKPSLTSEKQHWKTSRRFSVADFCVSN